MDITGLNITQIQEKIYPIVADYFKGCKLSSFKEWGFESFIFDLTELTHLIPDKHNHQFKDDTKFNGASGFIEFDLMANEYQNKTYILMIIADEFNINREYSNHDLENSDGGYVVLYSGGDLSEFSKINLDIKNLIPEHTTIIKCQNDVDYINSLILCNNDFTISIFMRADVAPENLLIC